LPLELGLRSGNLSLELGLRSGNELPHFTESLQHRLLQFANHLH
jgi:hypothetical protein